MSAIKAASLATVVGGLVLVGSWILQQTLLDRANGKLDRIYNAQSTFATYQSNNALFNAILSATAPGVSRRLDVRRSQVYNYELGLRDMEDLLSAKERRGIPPTLISQAFSSADIFVRLWPTLQARTVKIQAAVRNKRARILSEKNRLYWIFFALYLCGSTLVLSGTVLKTFKPN